MRLKDVRSRLERVQTGAAGLHLAHRLLGAPVPPEVLAPGAWDPEVAALEPNGVPRVDGPSP